MIQFSILLFMTDFTILIETFELFHSVKNSLRYFRGIAKEVSRRIIISFINKIGKINGE